MVVDPLPANSSFEKNRSEVCVVTQLIDYSNQIFSIASAGRDLHEKCQLALVWLHWPANLYSFCTNPEVGNN